MANMNVPPTREQEHAVKEALELEKLALEIDDIRRPWWQRPAYLGVLLPFLVGVGVFGLGIFSGFFKLEAKRIELATERLKLEERDLRDTARVLNDRMTGQRRVIAQQESLIGRLQVDRSEAIRERARVRGDLSRVMGDLSSAKARLSRPHLSFRRVVAPTERRAYLELENDGLGPAVIVSCQTFVDSRSVVADTPRNMWKQTLSCLDLGRETRFESPGVESQLEKANYIRVLQIEEGFWSEDISARFERALERLGVRVCYTSLLRDSLRSTTTGPVPKSETPCTDR